MSLMSSQVILIFHLGMDGSKPINSYHISGNQHPFAAPASAMSTDSCGTIRSSRCSKELLDRFLDVVGPWSIKSIKDEYRDETWAC